MICTYFIATIITEVSISVNSVNIDNKKSFSLMEKGTMLKEERHQKLLKVLAEKEFATVEELSKSLLVSMPTIRRDLTELARRKLIIRNHGGAMHIPMENVIAPVDFRKSVNYKKKNLLAREAVKFALNNMVVFLDGSTTASYLCDYLKGRPDTLSLPTA